MTDQQHIGSIPPAQGGQTSATLWTLFLGTAMLGLIAVKRGRTAPPQGSRLGHGMSERLGPEDSRVTHEGAAAERLAEHELARGRQANAPSEIPAKGWKDIALRLYRDPR